jgi:hypothetical protein
VAAHDGADRCRVGRAGGGGDDNARLLLEIRGPEHPGRCQAFVGSELECALPSQSARRPELGLASYLPRKNS